MQIREKIALPNWGRWLSFTMGGDEFRRRAGPARRTESRRRVDSGHLASPRWPALSADLLAPNGILASRGWKR